MTFPADVATQGFLQSPKSVASIRGRLRRLVFSLISWMDLLQQARELLQDEGGNCPIRYSDDMLLNGLNRGLQELARIRPDSMYDRYAGNSLNVPEIGLVAGPGVVDWLQDFDLDRRFWTALVHYVVGVTELSEDEYNRGVDGNPHASRAAASLRMFRRHVLSV